MSDETYLATKKLSVSSEWMVMTAWLGGSEEQKSNPNLPAVTGVKLVSVRRSRKTFDARAEAHDEEYLTIDELAARLKVAPKTIHNKMSSGIFRKGIHYFSPRGLRPRFKWSAVQDWLEGCDIQEQNVIQMRRGYTLNIPTAALWKESGH